MLVKFRNILLLVVVVLFSACELRLKPNDDTDEAMRIEVKRYDRLQSRYLTTGDFSALQQMNIDYPIETRTLVEKMLRLGEVSDQDISTRFLRFYQDSTLQSLVSDAEAKYANMDDINHQFRDAFDRLETMLPNIPMPKIYAQIGALDQSIVIGDKLIGISLDKYMGCNYPLYLRFYSAEQRKSMQRSYIVPDALLFYLLSLYPMENFDNREQLEKDLHVGKVMWVVNKAMHKQFFTTPYIKAVDKYMSKNKKVECGAMLSADDYTELKKYVE